MEEKFQQAEVMSVTPIGTGSRVCLDFVDVLEPIEGALIGNTGNGYVVVLSENRTTETYPARPFRINCGAIHQYIWLGDGKTTYLSEVKPGLEIPLVQNGQIRKVALGRVKIEKRPFIRVCCKLGDKEISVTLQESDSVTVLTSNQEEKAVIDLKQGDFISCLPDEPGRHLGEAIDEEINEF